MAVANAAIVEDGIWTGHDWYDDDLNIGIMNGEPFTNDPVVSRRITAPLSIDGDIS